MSYFPKGHHDSGDTVDDYDEFDPTPYGGGYDIFLTFGRPLEHSELTCYPKNSSTSEDSFDYDRPHYNSQSQPSAYADDVLDNEYKGYSRPKPRPVSQYGSGHNKPASEHGGSGYGRRPERSEYDEDKPSHERPSYGRNDDEDYRKPRRDDDDEGYGRKKYGDDDDDNEGRGRRKYGGDDDDNEGYGRKKYGDNNSDDDEEKKQRYKPHRRNDYDE